MYESTRGAVTGLAKNNTKNGKHHADVLSFCPVCLDEQGLMCMGITTHQTQKTLSRLATAILIIIEGHETAFNGF
jgi:hypothetical protein